VDHSDEYSKIPSFEVVAKPMDTFGKVMNLALSDKLLLQYFSYKDGVVNLRMKSGKELTSQLKELHVEFSKSYGTVFFELKSNGTKLEFYQTTNISENEWDAIASILCLAGYTSGKYIFSKDYQAANYVIKAINIISKL
jgi:hypothetical protein